jgi:hypothetical protein
MLSRLLRRFAAAVIAIGSILFIGGGRAEAALEFEIKSGATDDFFYASSNNFGQVTITTAIGNYTGQIETTFTNFAGSSSVGSISTTLNLFATGGATAPLTVSVMVVNNIAALDAMTSTPNAAISVTAAQLSTSVLSTWTGPSGTALVATANTSTSSEATTTAGTAATTTYFDSPPLAGSPAVPGTPVVTSGTLMLAAPGIVLRNANVTGTGTYSLSQSVTVDGITDIGNSPVNITGQSSISSVAVPEPSTLALAGLGALGFIGYGLRRRQVLGT